MSLPCPDDFQIVGNFSQFDDQLDIVELRLIQVEL
jgi:hypothetical protein